MKQVKPKEFPPSDEEEEKQPAQNMNKPKVNLAPMDAQDLLDGLTFDDPPKTQI